MTAAVIDFPTPAETAAPTPVGVLVELDPGAVAQHPDNVRDDIDPDSAEMRALIASVAEVGIVVPVLVVPVEAVTDREFDPAVTHVAVDGNRRQLAAARAGLPLRCEVRPDLSDAKATVRTMLVTGTTGQRLTRRQEVHGIQRALDLGLSATKVGKAMGRSRVEIQQAATVAKMSPGLVETAEYYDLTLEQLAELSEFEDDPAAADRLMRAAARATWDHAIAYERRERADAVLLSAALTQARDAAEAESLPVVDERPAYSFVLANLVDAVTGEAIDPDAHQSCPGHVVYLEAELYADEDEDGTETRTVEVDRVVYCLDPADRHVSRFGRRTVAAAESRPRPDESDSDYQARVEAEAAARAAQAEAAAETARAERRELVRLNKAALTAQEVRREFLHKVMRSTKHRKAMTAWAIEQIIRRTSAHRHWDGGFDSLPAILGNLARTGPYGLDHTATAEHVAPTMHGPILWAHVVAAIEDGTHKDFHRQRDTARADYFRHLETLGYVLAEPERLAVERAYPPQEDADPTVDGPADAADDIQEDEPAETE